MWARKTSALWRNTIDMDMKRTIRLKAIITILTVCWAARAGAEPETFPCLIEASSEVEIGSPVTGVIGSIEVERSDEVSKGQIVARLKSSVEHRSVDLAALRASDDAEIAAASAAMEHAKREKERAVTLYQKQLVSRQFLDKAVTEYTLATQKLEQARANRNQAKKELQLARAQLQQRTIRSPIDGIVTERYMSPGQRVQDAPIMKIVAIDPLKVDVVVPATYFNKLTRGQTMQIKPELAGLGEQTARINIVDRYIDAASNTFRVTLALPNPEKAIPPGARCTARLAPAKTPAVSKPAAPRPHQASLHSEPVQDSAVKVANRQPVQPQKVIHLIVDDKEYDPASNPFIR